MTTTHTNTKYERVLKAIRDRNGESNTKQARIDTGYTNASIHSAADTLEEKGWIEIQRRAVDVDESTKANKYTLTQKGREKAVNLGELVADSEMVEEVEALHNRVIELESKIESLEEEVEEHNDALSKADDIIQGMQKRIPKLDGDSLSD